MPELPEVETVKRGLKKFLVGKQVKDVSFDWPKSFPNDQASVSKFLIGASIIEVKRRAKILIINLSSNYSLVVHLKMTVQLVFKDEAVHFGAGHPNDSLVGNLPDKSTRVEITFIDNSKLFFNDQRKFGWMRLIPTEAINEQPFYMKLGPEPLEPDFKFKLFKQRLIRRKNSAIKPVIMDQTVIAGVGNIYADESLWAAKIHPLSHVGSLSDISLRLLHKELIHVLLLSIDKGGSTDRNYVNAEGKKGSYIDFANVFRKEGQACPRCGRTIQKIRVGGRGTHLCVYCQRIKN